MSDVVTELPWWSRFTGLDTNDGLVQIDYSFAGLNPGWALILGGAFFAASVFYYLRGPGELSRAKRITLACLRGCLFAVLFAILTRPVADIVFQEPGRGTLLVLMDTSASMGLVDQRTQSDDQVRAAIAMGRMDSGSLDRSLSERDRVAIAGKSRRELVEGVATNSDLFPKLAEKAALIFMPFSRDAENPVKLENADEPISREEALEVLQSMPSGGDATSLSDSIEAALRLTKGDALTGILLISDGANNAGQPVAAGAEALQRSQTPLYAYAVGLEAPDDIAVMAFSGPAVAFAEEKAKLIARVRATGFQGQSTTAVLKKYEEELERREVSIQSDGELEIVFEYEPPEAGAYEFTVELKPLDGENTIENNAATAVLRVVNQKVKVLIIEQKPRWEFRYLLDTLNRDERVDVKAVMLDGEPKLGSDPDKPFLAAIPSPRELLEYVIVVIGDVDPRRLGADTLEALESLARTTGGGIVFHAGPNYNPSAYVGTPLEGFFPVRLMRVSADQNPLYTKPAKLRLTPAGRRSPILQMADDPATNAEIWRSFPGVRWTAMTGPARPTAEVLLVDPNPTKAVDGSPQPVLALMPLGRGQSFFFGFDETWQWRSQVGREYYLKVWGQVFLELGVERLAGASDLVQLNVARSNYALGERVLIGGTIFDSDFKPLEALRIDGSLIFYPAESGDQPIRSPIYLDAREGRTGEFELELNPTAEGRYVVVTELDDAATVEFSVDAENIELRESSLSLEMLTQLTGSTERVFREENLNELPEMVTVDLPALERLERVDLAMNIFVYLTLFLLAVVEWALRRIWRMK